MTVEQTLLLECRGPNLRGLGGAKVSRSLEPRARRGARRGRNSRLEAPAGSKTGRGRVGLQGDNLRRTGVYRRPGRPSPRARRRLTYWPRDPASSGRLVRAARRQRAQKPGGGVGGWRVYVKYEDESLPDGRLARQRRRRAAAERSPTGLSRDHRRARGRRRLLGDGRLPDRLRVRQARLSGGLVVTLLVPSKKGGTKAGQYPDGPTRHVTAEGPGQTRPLCAEPDDPPRPRRLF